jgi:hypothetical protein
MISTRWLVAALAAAFATQAAASESPAPQGTVEAAVATAQANAPAGATVTVVPGPAPQGAAVRAYIDPETGLLVDRPVTEEQRRAEAEGLTSGPGAPVIEMRMPDGSVMAILNGNFEMASTAVVAPDGRLQTVCDDAAHAGQPRHVHLKPRAPAREVR